MTAVIVHEALSGGALEDRGGWTWAFACDQATPTGWAALTGGAPAALTLSGLVDLLQRTPDLGAMGAGSARIDKAVVGGVAGRFLSGAAYPSPVANKVLFRLVFRETRQTGTGTVLELSQAAQRVTIRRSATNLLLVGSLGAYTETIDFTPFFDGYCLLDVLFGAGGFTAYLNGVDLTPLFTGASPAAWGGAATLALLNNVAGTDAAVNTELVFAGLATSSTLTLEQHRADAWLLGVQEDGFAIDGLGDYTWAWSPNRIDNETAPAPSLPAEPDFGDLTARLAIDGEVTPYTQTNNMRIEGLGRPRREWALRPLETAAIVTTGTPSNFEVVDGDLHVRLVFKVLSTGLVVQRLLYLEDAGNASLVVGVDVDPTNGNLTLRAPSGYTAVVAGAVVRDEWHLLDVSLDRDGSGGNALLVAQLDGVALAVAGHSSTVSNIPAGAVVTVFDNKAHAAAATAAQLAFFAFTRGRVLGLSRHQLDAAALGVAT